jgi:hypothetical protein
MRDIISRTSVGQEPTWGETIEKMFPTREPKRGSPALVLVFLGVLGATYYFTRDYSKRLRDEEDE